MHFVYFERVRLIGVVHQAILSRAHWDSKHRLQSQFRSEMFSFVVHVSQRLREVHGGVLRQASAALGTWSVLSIQPDQLNRIKSVATQALRMTEEGRGECSTFFAAFWPVCSAGAQEQWKISQDRKDVVADKRGSVR